MNKYEIMFIVKPDVEEEARNTCVSLSAGLCRGSGCRRGGEKRIRAGVPGRRACYCWKIVRAMMPVAP